MRFTAFFLTALATAVLAQDHANMAGMGGSTAATPAAAPAGASPGATTPAAGAAATPKANGAVKANGAEDGKPAPTKVYQINDGQPQSPPQAPPGAPEGISKSTVTHATTKTHTKSAKPSTPAIQTKNAGNVINAGAGLGLLGLAAALIA